MSAAIGSESNRSIGIKRAYDDPAANDGVRVLVDRLWPRGVTTEHAHLDAWLKDIAPTPELRTWWNHDPDRLDEFAARYRAELDGNPATMKAIDEFWALSSPTDTTTLIYGAKDPVVNHARILAEYLTETQAQSARREAKHPDVAPGR